MNWLNRSGKVYYKIVGKRTLDLILAVIMLLVLFPVFVLLFILIAIYYRGTPFFSQSRPGKNAEIFQILKFKTMSDQKDDSGNILPDQQRITAFGKIIRKTSLDEIPQLINIIKGDMSLIGPRPLLVDYLPLYSDVQRRRHEVRPGITGWAQINGRNAISWDEKFKLDVWYIDNLSFALDLKILFQTLFNVLKGKGVSQQGHISMGRFEGSKM